MENKMFVFNNMQQDKIFLEDVTELVSYSSTLFYGITGTNIIVIDVLAKSIEVSYEDSSKDLFQLICMTCAEDEPQLMKIFK
jgi:hypothetical protein